MVSSGTGEISNEEGGAELVTDAFVVLLLVIKPLGEVKVLVTLD
jgi:hypothetical protein